METIVVIDGSTDGTKEFLENTDFGLPLTIHYQENKGRAAVRNQGASLASGELLIFIDDDMRMEPGCIEAHVNHHLSNPNSILTGAQIDDIQKAGTDFQVYKSHLSRAWANDLKSKEGTPQRFSELHITAANFSIVKALFYSLGGFDEELQDCEDYDLALRAFDKGIPIYYSEKAFGWHDDFPTPQSFIKRQLEYKQFNNYLYTRYPERYTHLLNSRLKKPGLAKRLFFSGFKSSHWLKAIEQDQFAFLPQAIRYKLYTWVITAHSTYKEHL